MPIADVVDRAADEVGGQPQAGLLVELDDARSVRGSGVPTHGWWLTVKVTTRPRPLTAVGAQAAPRHGGQRGRRVEQVAARLAAQEAEQAVRAGGPEEAVVVVERGEHAERGVGHGGSPTPHRFAIRSARVMAVTMPSSWNLGVPNAGVVSTSVAWARSAPTVACSRGMCANGS